MRTTKCIFQCRQGLYSYEAYSAITHDSRTGAKTHEKASSCGRGDGAFGAGLAAQQAAHSPSARRPPRRRSGDIAPLDKARDRLNDETSRRRAGEAAPVAPAGLPADAQNQLVEQYCASCHSERGKAGGLSLAGFDAAQVDRARRRRREDDPQAARRHDAAARRAASRAGDARRRSSTRSRRGSTRAAALNPNPGWRPFQRLNRAEYAARGAATCSASTSTSPPSCRPTRSATASTTSPTSQSFSPTLMEGYLRAASQISRLAVGDRNASADVGHLQDRPRPRRRCATSRRADGHARRHLGRAHLPGRRRLRRSRCRCTTSRSAASTAARRCRRWTSRSRSKCRSTASASALLDLNTRMSETDPKNSLEHQDAADSHQGRPAAHLRGVHPALRRPGRRPARADREHAGRRQHQLRHHHAAAHARLRRSSGRSQVTGVSDTVEPPQDLHAAARPAPSEEEACAAEIVKRLADAGVSAARRRADDLQDAMAFYEQGRKKRRLRERHPHGAAVDARQPALPVPPRAGAGDGDARGADLSHQPIRTSRRACRSSSGARCPTPSCSRPPSAGTLQHAGRPREAGAPHARRSRAPRRCRRASRRSGCGCRTSRRFIPDYLLYPQYDDTLAQAMQRETELFFDSLVREDRSRARPADRRLHVRQRAPGASTTASRTSPAARSAACTLPDVSPRHARPGQHPDADLGRRPHLAGAARQVGDGSAARHRRRRRRRRTCRRSTNR